MLLECESVPVFPGRSSHVLLESAAVVSPAGEKKTARERDGEN